MRNIPKRNILIVPQWYNEYESVEREADYETLIKFADYFSVSLDYLLGRTENK